MHYQVSKAIFLLSENFCFVRLDGLTVLPILSMCVLHLWWHDVAWHGMAWHGIMRWQLVLIRESYLTEQDFYSGNYQTFIYVPE
jgi:hypothetical protein